MKEYSKEELKKIQECELLLLDEFIKICGDNDLTYFAWGGTGIGALRHKGFIPWDDDIDLGMPAQDLEKLTEIIENQFSEKFSIISASTDINYPLPTTRLMLRGTQFCEETLKNINCDLGIFLDLYAFDNVPDDEKLYKSQARAAWFWSHIRLLLSINDPVIMIHGPKGALVRIACRIASFILRLTHVSPSYALKKENEARRRYAGVSTRRIAYLNDTSPFTATYPRDEVFPLRPLEFEGRQVYFPNKLEKHLSTLYGDFMTLPPVAKRKNHYPARLDFGPYADLPRCSPRS